MGIMDMIPKVPRLEKFCVCMDVTTGVRNTSIALVVLWAIYFLGALLGGGGAGNWVWALIWCSANIVVYLAVVWGMQKSTKIFLLPALIVSVFDFFVGIINGIINFILLNWFGAIWILALAALTAYYAIGLKNVYDDMSGAAPAAGEPSTDTKSPPVINPV